MSQQNGSSHMRIGIVGLTSSHVSNIVRYIRNNALPKWELTALGSIESTWSDHPETTKQRIVDLATQVLPTPHIYTGSAVHVATQMAPHIDAVLICDRDSRSHLHHAQEFLKQAIPTFVDKPFTENTNSTTQLIELAEKFSTPVQSYSAMRFHEQTLAAARIEHTACTKLENAWALNSSPNSTQTITIRSGYDPLSRWGKNFYAVHAAEMALTICPGTPDRVATSMDNHVLTSIVTFTHFNHQHSIKIELVNEQHHGYTPFSITTQNIYTELLLDPGYLLPVLQQWNTTLETGTPLLTPQDLLNAVDLTQQITIAPATRN